MVPGEPGWTLELAQVSVLSSRDPLWIRSPVQMTLNRRLLKIEAQYNLKRSLKRNKET